MREVKFGLIAAALVLLPAAAFAQGTLTGTVRDASGGVLPGVTVEAASLPFKAASAPSSPTALACTASSSSSRDSTR